MKATLDSPTHLFHEDPAVELWRRFANEAVSVTALVEPVKIWATESGAVAFVTAGPARIAVGSPFASNEAQPIVRRAFIDASRSVSKNVVFFGRELDLAEPLPKEAYVVGVEPWWRPSQWERTASSRTLRSQLRRAQRKRVRVESCSYAELTNGPWASHARSLAATWLRSRPMAPMSFAARVDPFVGTEERRYVLAHREGVLVGLLVATHLLAPNVWVIDHIMRLRTSPNGTAEALVDCSMRYFADIGASEVTLGLAPLCGPVPLPLQWARRALCGLYDFDGLYAFKSKFCPHRWSRVLLEHPGQHPSVATVRALRAFAGGSLVRFGLRSLLRCPPLVLRTIAIATVAWVFALVMWLKFYLSVPSLLPVWVAFDALFSAGLFWLGSHRIPSRHAAVIHRGLAAAATFDAAVSFVFFVAITIPHATRALQLVFAVLFWLLPSFVAAWLWSGLRFRDYA